MAYECEIEFTVVNEKKVKSNSKYKPYLWEINELEKSGFVVEILSYLQSLK